MKPTGDLPSLSDTVYVVLRIFARRLGAGAKAAMAN